MASPHLILPNLEFEFNLTGAPLPKRSQQMLLELKDNLRVLGGGLDYFWTKNPDKMPAPLCDLMDLPTPTQNPPAPYTLRPWGWDEESRRWQESTHGAIHPQPPSHSCVKKVNSKVFSAQLEVDLGLAAPGCHIAHTLDEVLAQIQAISKPWGWILKTPWGVSAQGRLLGRREIPNDGERRWILSQLKNAPLLVEPFFQRVADYSTQLRVEGDGQIQILGTTLLLNNKAGRYGGNRFGAAQVTPEIEGQLIAVAQVVGKALFAEGYIGPAGIDAFTYRDDADKIRLRPLVEINARQTFGAIALAFSPLLRPGQAAQWSLESLAHYEGQTPFDHKLNRGALLTCPRTFNGRPRSRVGVLTLL